MQVCFALSELFYIATKTTTKIIKQQVNLVKYRGHWKESLPSINYLGPPDSCENGIWGAQPQKNLRESFEIHTCITWTTKLKINANKFTRMIALFRQVLNIPIPIVWSKCSKLGRPTTRYSTYYMLCRSLAVSDLQVLYIPNSM